MFFACASLIAATSPVSAECGGLGAWPSFREVAPSAERILVGQVVRSADPELLQPRQTVVRGKLVAERTRSGSGGWFSVFEFDVEQVLRGEDQEGDSIVIVNLEPGVPLSYCPRDPQLLVTEGDVIAIAFNGRDAAGRTGVNAAAWIHGPREFSENARPNAERLTVLDLRRLVGLLPIDSVATATRPTASPWRV